MKVWAKLDTLSIWTWPDCPRIAAEPNPRHRRWRLSGKYPRPFNLSSYYMFRSCIRIYPALPSLTSYTHTSRIKFKVILGFFRCNPVHSTFFGDLPRRGRALHCWNRNQNLGEHFPKLACVYRRPYKRPSLDETAAKKAFYSSMKSVRQTANLNWATKICTARTPLRKAAFAVAKRPGMDGVVLYVWPCTDTPWTALALSTLEKWKEKAEGETTQPALGKQAQHTETRPKSVMN